MRLSILLGESLKMDFPLFKKKRKKKIIIPLLFIFLNKTGKKKILSSLLSAHLIDSLSLLHRLDCHLTLGVQTTHYVNLILVVVYE